MRRKRIIGLAICAGLVAWFFVPLPPAPELCALEGTVGGSPRSEIQSRTFRCDRNSYEMYISMSQQLEAGDLNVELLNEHGLQLVSFRFADLCEHTGSFHVGDGFRAGQSLKLRSIEHNFRGRYRVSLAQRGPITRWQRLLALWAVLLAVWLGMTVAYRAGWKRQQIRPWLPRVALTLFVVSLGPAYTAIHETGHALALWQVGALDLRGCDVLGIGGEPHAERNFVQLTRWGEALVAISGPALPTLVGYAAFLVWLPVRRAWREKHPMLLACVSTFAMLMLFAQAGATGPWLAGVHDGDFLGFVRNLPWPEMWMTVGMAFVACLNLALIAVIFRTMVPDWRQRLARIKARGRENRKIES